MKKINLTNFWPFNTSFSKRFPASGISLWWPKLKILLPYLVTLYLEYIKFNRKVCRSKNKHNDTPAALSGSGFDCKKDKTLYGGCTCCCLCMLKRKAKNRLPVSQNGCKITRDAKSGRGRKGPTSSPLAWTTSISARGLCVDLNSTKTVKFC